MLKLTHFKRAVFVAVEPQWNQNQKKKCLCDLLLAQSSQSWIVDQHVKNIDGSSTIFEIFRVTIFRSISWIDCKSLCKFNSAQRVILYTSIYYRWVCLFEMSWNVQTSDPSACPFLIRPTSSLPVRLNRKLFAPGCVRQELALPVEISEGLVTMFPEKALRTEKTWENPMVLAMLRIPPSKTTCIFGQIKWHSFGIRPPQERIVHQAKFAENIHKVSSAEYSQPGKLHEDWRRHNKCFKFGANKLVVKADKSSKWYTIYKSSFIPLRVLLCGCGFFLIEAIPRCLWPENQLWRVRQSLPTSLNEVERAWFSVPLDSAQAEMIRQTFAISCNVSITHTISVTIKGTSYSFTEFSSLHR